MAVMAPISFELSGFSKYVSYELNSGPSEDLCIMVIRTALSYGRRKSKTPSEIKISSQISVNTAFVCICMVLCVAILVFNITSVINYFSVRIYMYIYINCV